MLFSLRPEGDVSVLGTHSGVLMTENVMFFLRVYTHESPSGEVKGSTSLSIHFSGYSSLVILSVSN